MKIDRTSLTNILINCYRKFKSHVLFSNNLDYIKRDIAYFEYDSSKIEKTFYEIADALIAEKDSYFNDLISRVSVKVFAKSFRDERKNDLIVSNVDNGSIVMTKANFFISAPVEVFVLDTFWSTLFGQVLHDNEDYRRTCYANKIHQNLYKGKKNKTLIERVNYNSLSLFEQYYHQYALWKNSAIGMASRLHSVNKDTSIACFDLSRYFYSVNIDFCKIRNDMICFDQGFLQYDYLTGIIEKLYKNYSKVLKKYDYSIASEQIVIPVGLISSSLISDFYLLDFDKQVKSLKGVKKYGRYVDDVLIVFAGATFNSFEELVAERFNGLIVKEGNKYYINNHYNVHVQESKTKIINIYKDGGTNILDKLMVDMHPSEPRLFPSYKIDINEFLSDISSKEEVIKVRDANANILNTKKLISAINGYIILRKYTDDPITGENGGKEKINDAQLSKLLELLNPRSLLGLCTRWNKLFLFAYLHSNGTEIVKRITRTIENGINNFEIDLENESFFNSARIKKAVIDGYRDSLVMAESSYLALRGVKENRLLKTKLAIRLRKANLIDYNAISIPLSNYIYDLPANFNLMGKIDLAQLSFYAKKGLDSLKIKYSPRFVNLGEYSLFNQITKIYNKSIAAFNDEDLNNYYDIINRVFGKSINQVQIRSFKSAKDTYTHQIINIADKHYNTDWFSRGVYIGLANINLSKQPVIDKNNKLVLDSIYEPSRKRDLINLLNDCFINQTTYYYSYETRKRRKKRPFYIERTKKPVSYLVFPETFLPIAWIPVLIKYSRNSGAVIVTGIKYIDINKRIINLQAVIVPFTTSDYHKQSLVFLREKNNYSPFEQEYITKSGRNFVNHTKPLYYTFAHRGVAFSPFICYELTDIFARALIRNYSEIVFASEYNKDINYFSNIIESTSRDLSSFVVQVNSSECGDTRIIAPYRDKFKNIASITGGVRDSVHIGRIDLVQQREYLKEFFSHEKDCDYSSINAKKFGKNKKPSANTKRVKALL